jgi:hypothetical protein
MVMAAWSPKCGHLNLVKALIDIRQKGGLGTSWGKPQALHTRLRLAQGRIISWGVFSAKAQSRFNRGSVEFCVLNTKSNVMVLILSPTKSIPLIGIHGHTQSVLGEDSGA